MKKRAKIFTVIGVVAVALGVCLLIDEWQVIQASCIAKESGVDFSGRLEMVVKDIELAEDERTAVFRISITNMSDEAFVIGDTDSSRKHHSHVRRTLLRSVIGPGQLFGYYTCDKDKKVIGSPVITNERILYSILPGKSVEFDVEFQDYQFIQSGIECLAYKFSYLKHGSLVDDEMLHFLYSKPAGELISKKTEKVRMRYGYE